MLSVTFSEWLRASMTVSAKAARRDSASLEVCA
jgi:hypothetical protein